MPMRRVATSSKTLRGGGTAVFSAFTNIASALARIHLATEIEKKRFSDATYKAAQEIMQISKTRYVPIATGALMKSGRVDRWTKGGEPYVEMKYGGPPDYAVYVHEIDKNYNNGRTWKYLEKAAKEYRYTIEIARIYRSLPGA